MEIADYIQLGLLIAATITIIVTCIYNSKAIKTTCGLSERQLQFQFFREYTRRYQELILHMPETIYPSSDKDIYMRLYFNLCSEEFYLQSKGVIDKYVWRLWVEGISTAMKKQNYQTAWKSLGTYYDDENFIRFMNNLTRDKV